MRYDLDSCPKCGAPKRKPSKQCGACWRKSRRENTRGTNFRCADCNEELGDKGHRAKRCWSCWSKYRLAKPQRWCTVPGCPRPHRAKGYCMKHYQNRLQPRSKGEGRGGRLLAIVKDQPCQLCNYNTMRSHVHRLVPGSKGGKYRKGNVVALCARCHEEVHQGLVSAPPPLNVYAHPSSSPLTSG